jgi:hypothetical protein
MFHKRPKNEFNVPTNMNHGVASSLSWSKSICNLKMTLQEVEGPQQIVPPFEGEDLNGQTRRHQSPPRESLCVPTWLVWKIKFTHIHPPYPSIVLTIGGLTLGFPWDMG